MFEHLHRYLPEFAGGLTGYILHEVHHRFYRTLITAVKRAVRR